MSLDGADAPQDALSVRVFLVYWFNTTIILLLWAIAYAGYKAFERWRLGEIDRWRTQALLREAELDLLKAQLDPHFVFNALNNIRAVILENPQRARDMLTHLSQSLRHVLQHSQRSLVSLREELAAVDDYLALIDLHTDGALQVSRAIDPHALDVQVPPLAVQLLIENAVKHGASSRDGALGLMVSKANDRVTIEVSNPGRLGSGMTGIGLPNLRERLFRAFGSKASCELSERDARVYATLSVPR
jgi:LytS/YehU family sensor histidine kinase